MSNAYPALLHAIHSHSKELLTIAIDGRCASGKTTLADRLKEEFDCNIIHMDHFFLQPRQRTKQRLAEPGGNVDYERFVEEVVLPFRKGLPFSYRVFDCHKNEFVSDVPVKPDVITIVEGAYSCHPVLWDIYDFRVFMNIDPEEQICRIRGRNGEEALKEFRERWIPLEEKYFSTYHIQECCDFLFQ